MSTKFVRILAGMMIVVSTLIAITTVQVTPSQAQRACPPGIGPGGVHAGGEYAPQNLTQEQRQWLYVAFGHDGIAPDGYGGEPCGGAPTSVPKPPAYGCNTQGTGPGGIRPGGYTPQNLSQEQRQWLWDIFGHPGIAPAGYGGENCTAVNGTYNQPPQASNTPPPQQQQVNPTAVPQQQPVNQQPVVDGSDGDTGSYGQQGVCPGWQTHLSVGTKGVVGGSDPTPVRIRFNPSHGKNVRDLLYNNTTFTVVGGPQCNEGITWWKIQISSTLVGWSAEGDSSGYWLVPVSQGNQSQAIITESVALDGGAHFMFEFNPQTCEILNGGDFIASEIHRLHRGEIGDSIHVLHYLAEVFGLVESNRKQIEASFASASCPVISYLMGHKGMDTSGPGNMIFGYYAAYYDVPLINEDNISNIAQAANPLSLFQFWDNPDDRQQRRIGRAVYSLTSDPNKVTGEEITRASDQMLY